MNKRILDTTQQVACLKQHPLCFSVQLLPHDIAPASLQVHLLFGLLPLLPLFYFLLDGSQCHSGFLLFPLPPFHTSAFPAVTAKDNGFIRESFKVLDLLEVIKGSWRIDHTHKTMVDCRTAQLEDDIDGQMSQSSG